jgi:DNA-binding SARP family transcriptional activator
MKKVITLLKMSIQPSIAMIIKMLLDHVLQPYMETQIPAVQQRYGDHLAELGAVQELKKFLERLDDIGIEREEEWVVMSIVRSILWNFSDASKKLAKEIGKCGLLKRFINEMQRFGTSAPQNEV